MQLLVAVINDPLKIDEILTGLLELGVRGATVIASEGMGMRLAQDIPLFARLQIPIARARPENRTIFSVVDEERVDAVMALLQRVCGDLSRPGTGIAFTVPIDRLVGLAASLTEGTSAARGV
jgi:nitrogen regulatory protein PII